MHKSSLIISLVLVASVAFVLAVARYSTHNSEEDYCLGAADIYRYEMSLRILGYCCDTARLDSIIQHTDNEDSRIMASMMFHLMEYNALQDFEGGYNYFDSIKDISERDQWHPYLKFFLNLERHFFWGRQDLDPDTTLELLTYAVSFLEPYPDIYAQELSQLYDRIATTIEFNYGEDVYYKDWRSRAVDLIEKHDLYPEGIITSYNYYLKYVEALDIDSVAPKIEEIYFKVPDPDKNINRLGLIYELMYKIHAYRGEFASAEEISSKMKDLHESGKMLDFWYYYYFRQTFEFDVVKLKRNNRVQTRYEELRDHYKFYDHSGGKLMFYIEDAMVEHARNLNDVQLRLAHIQNLIQLWLEDKEREDYSEHNSLNYEELVTMQHHLLYVHDTLGIHDKKLATYLTEIQGKLLNLMEARTDGFKIQLDHLRQVEVQLAKENENRAKERVEFYFLIITILCLAVFFIGSLMFKLKNYSGKLSDQKSELEDLNVQLLRSNESLENFASIAAHDLKSPLVTIIGVNEFVVDKYAAYFDDEDVNLLNLSRSNSLNAVDMINALLNFSSLKVDQAKLQNVNMKVELSNVLNQLKVPIENRAAQVSYPEQLPMVMSTGPLIAEVLMNLINNALKFSPDNRRPEIQLSWRDLDNGFVEFSIRDNGIGIPEDALEKIFNAFHRLHAREKFSGNGIGLAVCKKIIDRNGGEIWVESEVNVGSTFYFTLKKADAYDNENVLELERDVA